MNELTAFFFPLGGVGCEGGAEKVQKARKGKMGIMSLMKSTTATDMS